MGEKSDHITDFRPYYCTALNLQGSWFSASDAARLERSVLVHLATPDLYFCTSVLKLLTRLALMSRH
jgi:hypothetical protein